jgi:hypothetical protein
MNRLSEEKGQAIFLAAGLLFLFLVIAAVVIDLGWWLHDKRDAQNDVDASVLAGAQDLPGDLPGQPDPCDTAGEWAARNNASGQLSACTTCRMDPITGVCGEDPPHNLIRATVERPASRLEKGLLDIDDFNISASAAAAKMKAVAACVMPWGVVATDTMDNNWGLPDPELDQLVGIVYAPPPPAAGNFGILQLYGKGIDVYRETIKTPCGSGTVDACDQTDPEVCVGCTLTCDSETGLGGTAHDKALTGRDANSVPPAGPFCDVATYDQAVEMVKTSAACAAARAVLIPIIDALPRGGAAPLQILGLATFYVADWAKTPADSWDADGDTNNDMVWGYFLENVPVIPAWNITWGYSDDPFAPISILLVE